MRCMAGSRCRVSYTDPEGIVHAVAVDAPLQNKICTSKLGRLWGGLLRQPSDQLASPRPRSDLHR
jgi:hypothetical protein